MKIKSVFPYCLVFLLLLCCLWGCGEKTDAVSTEEETGELDRIDVLAQTWSVFQEIRDAKEEWSVVEYIDEVCALPGDGLLKGTALSAVKGDDFYCIQEYHSVENEVRVYLSYLS